jgi:Mg-chelatase subunit ChlD
MGTMKRFVPLALLAIALACPVLADTRTENIDVIVALDRSLSMEKKVEAVKSYVTTYLIDQVLIPGDTFIVVAFYGKTELIVSQTISGDADKASVKKVISKIRGNGRFTDIGNALDALQQQVDPLEKDGRKKFILLLTDGIQEAPPVSKYYSKDGKFNHAFLANTKTIQQKGWKIQILGIGTDTAARDLARELEGSYTEIQEGVSVDTILSGTEGLFGQLSLEGPVGVSSIPRTGVGTLSFLLKAEGYKEEARVNVDGIAARIGSSPEVGILDAPFAFSVRPSGATRVTIPVRFPPDLPAGPTPAGLSFSFAAGERFSPSEVSVTLSVRGWLGNNLILVVAAAAVLLALVVLLVLLIRRLVRGSPIHFAVTIEGEPVAPGTVSLAAGRELLLNEASGAFSLVRQRNARSLARFKTKGRALTLEILKADRFPKLAEVPPDARGKSFVMRSEHGEKLTMKVVSKERAK